MQAEVGQGPLPPGLEELGLWLQPESWADAWSAVGGNVLHGQELGPGAVKAWLDAGPDELEFTWFDVWFKDCRGLVHVPRPWTKHVASDIPWLLGELRREDATGFALRAWFRQREQMALRQQGPMRRFSRGEAYA